MNTDMQEVSSARMDTLTEIGDKVQEIVTRNGR